VTPSKRFFCAEMTTTGTRRITTSVISHLDFLPISSSFPVYRPLQFLQNDLENMALLLFPSDFFLTSFRDLLS
jgi:hypothetical protein